MEGNDQKELQLLPSQQSLAAVASSSSFKFRQSPMPISDHHYGGPPSLDLQLSISVTPMSATRICDFSGDGKSSDTSCVEALKWQAAEQIRLAAIEKAYAERVRELTRREMELAQSEFARARHMWQRAREEVEKAERLKERATRQIDSTCMEITCQSCRQRFKPN
ncbi:zinc finger protein SHOOT GRAVITROPISM 5 [Euphorbia lathyris]|uniref:zinc finger protein SHOOT GRAVITROPISM 5 n=1 Tax=Euphorbia lathyris TaxID=212925 RepID=UPI0033133C70